MSGTIGSHMNTDYMQENLSRKNHKNVVYQKFKHLDDVIFRVSQRHQFSPFSYFRRSDILGCDVIMQMRPEGSRLCLFTSMSLVHVKHKIYKFAVHVNNYQPCAINIPSNTLFCLLQKHPLDKKAKFLVIASIHS